MGEGLAYLSGPGSCKSGIGSRVVIRIIWVMGESSPTTTFSEEVSVTRSQYKERNVLLTIINDLFSFLYIFRNSKIQLTFFLFWYSELNE